MGSRRILVLGATGMLGRPVARCLVERGHRVRVLARSVENARRLFGDSVEIAPGSALDEDRLRAALAGCDAVHINLAQESELAATRSVVALSDRGRLERVTYVSATTACEANRWFQLVDVKVRCEAELRRGGPAHVVFCPTWAMETLCNFVHGNRAAVVVGEHPPPLHFFAAVDFGRMVAVSYDDDRALGKRLFVHGPEGVTLPEALERFFKASYPRLKVTRLRLWQARLIATWTRRKALGDAVRLIAYFDRVGELGDPAEANALLGAPSITLADWFKMPREGLAGSPR